MSYLKRVLTIVAVIAVLLLVVSCFVHYQETNQVAIMRNMITNEIRLEDRAGFHVSEPWIQVARIDTRPMKVCISSASRAFNCKLAQFNPTYYREFVAVEGFHYYWFYNRFSFNWGYDADEEYRGMGDVLRGYAFSVQQYPFVEVSAASN